jgi:hypothetical protein
VKNLCTAATDYLPSEHHLPLLILELERGIAVFVCYTGNVQFSRGVIASISDGNNAIGGIGGRLVVNAVQRVVAGDVGQISRFCTTRVILPCLTRTVLFQNPILAGRLRKREMNRA